jgi:DNA (cytosine-5)-methyltransferase 1
VIGQNSPIAFHNRQDPDVSGDMTHPLGAKDNGLGVAMAVPMAMRESGQGFWMQDEIAGTLRAEGENRPSRPSNVIAQPIECASGDITHPLGAKDNGLGYPAVLAPTLTATNDPSRSPQSSEITAQVAAVTATTLQVRRLTPIECERLQGFPDGYTDIRSRGKDTPDGPRYKALGNSMAVPVMRWIGERIAAVDKL